MIDKRYIDEAVRIRIEFLENLINVKKFEKIYQELLIKLEDSKEKIDSLDPKNTSLTEDNVIKMAQEISIELNLVIEKIKPYSEKTKELDDKQRILYKTIKEKYPNITDEDIYKEIVPVIARIDENFDI